MGKTNKTKVRDEQRTPLSNPAWSRWRISRHNQLRMIGFQRGKKRKSDRIKERLCQSTTLRMEQMAKGMPAERRTVPSARESKSSTESSQRCNGMSI
jgi:hypothetical protein